MSAQDCTAVIDNRHINEKGQCKQINTFIKAKLRDIKNVCTTGKSNGKSYTSNTKFDVIDCTFDKKEDNSCKYEGNCTKRRITLTCEGGLPVHFQKKRYINVKNYYYFQH